jgi:hypothetical protein
VVVEVGSSCGGGGVALVEAPLDGGGGADGHTMDLVTGDLPSGSPALDLGDRVPVGCPCAPTWILVVRLGADPGGKSGTRTISMRSSSSSSSATSTPSPPSLGLSDESFICLNATG